ncbi:MAG: alpha-amylase family protein [Gemmatimonadaceae bacterium]
MTSSRRDFVASLGAGAVTLGRFPWTALDGQSIPQRPPRLWIDPKLANLPKRPWRKIHQDFHNTAFIPKIGARFNADEYGDRLVAGNVDAIVVFAKDMHGYFYYPSQYGPVHPGLSFDLLGEQVRACRARQIAVYAYYCTTWDHNLANTHHEWLVIDRDGSNHLPKPGHTPAWTALCLSHEPFQQLMADHTKEFVSRYELDGAWFDMAEPVAPECFCDECLRQLQASGKDAQNAQVQREHKNQLFVNFHQRMSALVKATRPGCQVDYNDIGLGRLGDRVASLDNADVEALPTASWGYFYFPAQVRYTRPFGITSYGMTGRFKASWADFGGLKLPAQLQMECAAIVAQGARCDIGDQLPPDGRLDPAVYHVIGKAYGVVKRLEPYLEGAVPVAEAALMTNDLALGRPTDPTILGWCKVLSELRYQYDIVEPGSAWERYGLIILPGHLRMTAETVKRLHTYIANGGAVVSCHESGLLADADGTWLDRYGFTYAGASPFAPAYLVPRAPFTGAIPEYAYALYEGASQWRVGGAGVSLAQLGEPLFQRSPEHYTSHAQTPFDHLTDFTAMAVSGNVGLIGFPLGLSYFQQGYWVYREALRHLLGRVGPTQLVESNAPMSTEIAVTHQAANRALGRHERYLVHVINFSPMRTTPDHPQFCEDPIALTDVRVRLRVPGRVTVARAVMAGRALQPRSTPDGVEFTLDRVPIHELVSLELA